MKKQKEWKTLIKNLRAAHIKYMDALLEYNLRVSASHARQESVFNIVWKRK